MTTLLRFLITFTVTILSACFIVDKRTDYSEIQREVSRHREIWQKNAIQNYQYVATEYCFCAQRKALIVVLDGSVAQVDLLPPLTGSGNIQGLDLTMEQRFDLIEEGINKRYDEIHVSYNKNYGFPAEISFNPYKNAIDDEIAYIAYDFEVVSNP